MAHHMGEVRIFPGDVADNVCSGFNLPIRERVRTVLPVDDLNPER